MVAIVASRSMSTNSAATWSSKTDARSWWGVIPPEPTACADARPMLPTHRVLLPVRTHPWARASRDRRRGAARLPHPPFRVRPSRRSGPTCIGTRRLDAGRRGVALGMVPADARQERPERGSTRRLVLPAVVASPGGRRFAIAPRYTALLSGRGGVARQCRAGGGA